MEIYYHGSKAMFERFDLAHALEGDGKVKFGFGIYVTSHYSSAQHYAAKGAVAQYYVYKVSVPAKREDNYIAFKQPVAPAIVQRAAEQLGTEIPEKATQDGKDFRKFLAKRLTGRVDLEGEKAASAFLVAIGVDFIEWPYNWRNPALGTNRAILDQDKVTILSVDTLQQQRAMSFYSVAPFIQQFYPQYYSIERYPAAQCVCLRRVDDEWGVLVNFARTPLLVNNVPCKSAEQLFQLMKFVDPEPVLAVYNARNPKMTAKHWEQSHRRADWGSMIVDAMKYCLTVKYEKSEAFASALRRTAGRHIVEDQTTFRKRWADTWGVKLEGEEYVGPNLLGRLLMELRDQGRLKSHLPDDALAFTQFLPQST